MVIPLVVLNLAFLVACDSGSGAPVTSSGTEPEIEIVQPISDTGMADDFREELGLCDNMNLGKEKYSFRCKRCGCDASLAETNGNQCPASTPNLFYAWMPSYEGLNTTMSGRLCFLNYPDFFLPLQQLISSTSNDEIYSSSSVLQNSSHNSSSSTIVQAASSSAAQKRVVYGTLVDDRDGQTYKTVVIGSQTWMAENLNYGDLFGVCYLELPDNCSKYGRLYTWGEAMDYDGVWSTNAVGCSGSNCAAIEPVRGVCPEGWHLPSDAEWKTLFVAIGDSLKASIIGDDTVANYLDVDAAAKIKSTSGWPDELNGTDLYGFTVLPAGGMDRYGWWTDQTRFWSFKTKKGFAYSYGVDFVKYRDISTIALYLNEAPADEASSIRCLKDNQENGLLSSSVVFTDSRDGKKYKTVVIGNQTWMAENLNYEMANSYCYGNDVKKCTKKNGRLYTWTAAMSACPKGWHLPSDDEWWSLIETTESSFGYGGKLKSWYDGGWDAYGFSAFLVGYKSYRLDSFDGYAQSAMFWSSTECDSHDNEAYHMSLNYRSNSDASVADNDKDYGFSVRCLKD